MPDRRRFAIGVTSLLALLGVAAAILLPSGAAPAAAQSTGPAVVCFEISVGWRICAASAPAPIAAASPLPPTTLTYGPPVTTGSVTDDGDYAFLTDPDDLTTLVTTYEGLRDGLRTGNPIGLVMHQNDISGASQEAFYDLVEAGDVVEWREAADCWVRYHVDEVHADPRGYPPRTLLTIQVYSYAFTGCTSGPITTRGTRTFTWTPETIRTGNITVPFYHGSSLIAPEGWTGTLPEPVRVTPIDTTWPPDPLPAPDLGPGWTGSVSATGADYGYALYVFYTHESGGWLEGYFYRLPVWPRNIYFMTNTPRVTANSSEGVYEWFVLDGRPAEIGYDLEEAPRKNAGIYFYDADTGVLYTLWSNHKPPANETAVLIEIARKFLPAARDSSCQPRGPADGLSSDAADLGLEDCGLPSTTLTYGAPVTTGAITDDGDYAFLTDPDDLTSAVTTYEGLRDGLRKGNPIGLVINQSDSAGTSQAAFYDLVEEGDVVEWREVADCWVRYHVDEVHADPRGYPPRTLLTIQVYSYAFTGCTSRPITTTGTRTFTWTPEMVQTGNFAVPIQHGPFLVVPHAWSETIAEPVSITPAAITWPPDPIPQPDLGPGWSGSTFLGYGGRLEGYYRHEDRGTFIINIFQVYRWPDDVQRIGGVGADLSREFVNEYRVIDGLPAWVSYEYVLDDTSSAVVVIYNPATGVMYSASGGTIAQRNDPEATIALARKFLPDAR